MPTISSIPNSVTYPIQAIKPSFLTTRNQVIVGIALIVFTLVTATVLIYRRWLKNRVLRQAPPLNPSSPQVPRPPEQVQTRTQPAPLPAPSSSPEQPEGMLPHLPTELRSKIAETAGFPLPLLCLSKQFLDPEWGFFFPLFNSYKESPLLAERAKSIEHDTPDMSYKDKVQTLHDTLVYQVDRTWFGHHLTKETLKMFNPLSVERLNRLQTRLDSIDLNNFVRIIARSLPEAQHFLDYKFLFKVAEDRALHIREWMRTHPAELAKLTELDLTGIRKVPKEIELLTHLRVLKLHHNEPTIFPLSILNLSHLEELHLSGGALQNIPNEINRLSRLRVLHLSNIRLTTVPAEIGQLSQLEVLNLDCNQLKNLPDELRLLPLLKTLNTTNNPLTELSPDMRDFVASKKQ